MRYNCCSNGRKRDRHKPILQQKHYTQSNQSPWAISYQSKIHFTIWNFTGTNGKHINFIIVIALWENESPNIEAEPSSNDHSWRSLLDRFGATDVKYLSVRTKFVGIHVHIYRNLSDANDADEYILYRFSLVSLHTHVTLGGIQIFYLINKIP